MTRHSITLTAEDELTVAFLAYRYAQEGQDETSADVIKIVLSNALAKIRQVAKEEIEAFQAEGGEGEEGEEEAEEGVVQ